MPLPCSIIYKPTGSPQSGSIEGTPWQSRRFSIQERKAMHLFPMLPVWRCLNITPCLLVSLTSIAGGCRSDIWHYYPRTKASKPRKKGDAEPPLPGASESSRPKSCLRLAAAGYAAWDQMGPDGGSWPSILQLISQHISEH